MGTQLKVPKNSPNAILEILVVFLHGLSKFQLFNHNFMIHLHDSEAVPLPKFHKENVNERISIRKNISDKNIVPICQLGFSLIRR